MKKAQLSVETMIIYGIVILIALSVIGGLIYFDVFSLENYLPNSCDLGGTGDLTCEEMKLVSGGDFELGIRNTGSRAISILTVTLTDETAAFLSTDQTATATVGGTAISGTNALAPGDIAIISIGSISGDKGIVMKGVLTTAYMYRDGAITQESTGSIRIKAS